MKDINLPKVIVIAGPNASGKSSLAIELAKRYNGEILSADSRQVYKGFDLCSGKVTKEEMDIIPHHMIDIRNVGEAYSVSEYQKTVYELIPQIVSRSHIPFLVGGTGLYISSVVYGYQFEKELQDPKFRKELEEKSVEELQKMLPQEALEYFNGNRSDLHNKRRLIRVLERLRSGEKLSQRNQPIFNTLQLGVTWKKETLHRKIEERLRDRLDKGMVEEVRNYLNDGFPPDELYRLGLEYRYISWYVEGKYASFDEFYQDLLQAIKRFAKRQMIWFKRDKTIHWLDMENDGLAQASVLIDSFLA